MTSLVKTLTRSVRSIGGGLSTGSDSSGSRTLGELAIELRPIVQFFGNGTPRGIGSVFKDGRAVRRCGRSVNSRTMTDLQLCARTGRGSVHGRKIPAVGRLLGGVLRVLATRIRGSGRASRRIQRGRDIVSRL